MPGSGARLRRRKGIDDRSHISVVRRGSYLAVLFLAWSVGASASSWPAPPRWWLREAACIRAHEGEWDSNTGNGYYGAYQFVRSTWASVGGMGYPHLASPAEQTYRAWLVWKRDGGSWREWGTAGQCGLS
jgi:hypothetical protein